MLAAVVVETAPQVETWLSVAQHNVEERNRTFLLALRLLLLQVDTLSLVEDTILHIEPKKVLEAAGR